MGKVNESEPLVNIESNDELKKLISSSQNGKHGSIQSEVELHGQTTCTVDARNLTPFCHVNGTR
jgi:hypothetical protein